MTTSRPHAATAEAGYLALILDELQAQGEVLAQIRDHFDPQTGPVLVSEPSPATPPRKSQSALVTEPRKNSPSPKEGRRARAQQ